MRRRLTVISLVLVLLVPALAAVAYTAVIDTCHGCYTVWDPPTTYCTGGESWHFRSYTWDFGPFDSTGTTSFQYQRGDGTAVTRNFSGEHDGVTRTHDSGATGLRWGSAYYFNMSSVGSGRVDIYCD